MKSSKPKFFLLVSSSSVVPIIVIPESMLAQLYTANKISVQLLRGRRSDILNEVVPELRYCVSDVELFFVPYLGINVVIIVHAYVTLYISGRNSGCFQISST